MSGYTTPVTDRAASDIVARNSKAFINVADRVRIYHNSYLVSALASVELGTTITFNALTDPTTTSFPTVTEWNTLLANIEAVRLAVAALSIPGTSTGIKDDWEAGPGKHAPDYTDANLWESTLDAIWDYYNGSSLTVDLVLSGDLTVPTNTKYVVIDSIDTNGYNIIVESGETLAIL